MVDFLLSIVANHRGFHSPTPVFGAAHEVHLDVIKLLVKNRANTRHASGDGLTTAQGINGGHNELAYYLMSQFEEG